MNQKTTALTFAIILFLICGMCVYAYLVLQSDPTATKTSSQNEQSESATDQLSFDLASLPPGISYTEAYELPVPGSVATQNLLHTINLDDVRRGCFRLDCIPSIEDPQFVPASELSDVLAPDSLGLVLWDAGRFYPFPMLETHELVNETLPDGTPVLISYCPLCGTGIVFKRELDGAPVEFGVSGMLWQSNLLMYNRASDVSEQNLWSQVLGQAVIGERAGEPLEVLPSDIITFADWLEVRPDGETLVSGPPRDPYNGNYYEVAQNFAPDFDFTQSPLEPETYVHGIVVNDVAKAYVSEALFDGMTDVVGGERVFVSVTDGQISFTTSNAERAAAPSIVPDKEGFWFSWKAAYPDTLLWTGE